MADTPNLVRIVELIARTIRQSTGRELDIAPDDALVSSGYLDSMSMVQLVIAMQTEFGVEFDVADLNAENFESARSIFTLLASNAS